MNDPNKHHGGGQPHQQQQKEPKENKGLLSGVMDFMSGITKKAEDKPLDFEVIKKCSGLGLRALPYFGIYGKTNSIIFNDLHIGYEY